MPSGDSYHCARFDDGTVTCSNINNPHDTQNDPFVVAQNLATQKWIAAPENDHLQRIPLGTDTIALNNTTVTLLANAPTNATRAELHMVDGTMRFGFDATPMPVATLQAQGIRLVSDAAYALEASVEIATLQMTSQGANATLVVRYFVV
jgi:hypothetical protein